MADLSPLRHEQGELILTAFTKADKSLYELERQLNEMNPQRRFKAHRLMLILDSYVGLALLTVGLCLCCCYTRVKAAVAKMRCSSHKTPQEDSNTNHAKYDFKQPSANQEESSVEIAHPSLIQSLPKSMSNSDCERTYDVSPRTAVLTPPYTNLTTAKPTTLLSTQSLQPF